MIAHTMGNPFDVDRVMDFARRHKLWVIEDCADALGSLYKGKKTGTFGNFSTFSFYPAHHITMGEGGAVLTNDAKLKIIVESLRDWGRDCWCATGCDNTCGKRFGWKLGDLPYGYDHKYIYSHIGYNLKLTDMQAAVGCIQLDKLPDFIKRRRENFNYLYKGLEPLEEFLILPQTTPNSKPSWFGFLITVKESSPISRNKLAQFLEDRKITTRFLFGGNLIHQPAYKGIKYRKVGNLEDSDRVMHQSFWIGVYPGLTEEMLSYIVSTFRKFFR
jgi:CDP-6-deoxy-D-xylo-4-hexulose-3-dehydrase